MTDTEILQYVIKDPLELNLSYMPFVQHGGLFVPSQAAFNLGDRVIVDLFLPGKQDAIRIEGIVVWITPKNALHHVLPGIGIQFSESQANLRGVIENQLDRSMEVGGYVYGITEKGKRGQ